jgi:hypothetical protein
MQSHRPPGRSLRLTVQIILIRNIGVAGAHDGKTVGHSGENGGDGRHSADTFPRRNLSVDFRIPRDGKTVGPLGKNSLHSGRGGGTSPDFVGR